MENLTKEHRKWSCEYDQTWDSGQYILRGEHMDIEADDRSSETQIEQQRDNKAYKEMTWSTRGEITDILVHG